MAQKTNVNSRRFFPYGTGCWKGIMSQMTVLKSAILIEVVMGLILFFGRIDGGQIFKRVVP